VTGRTPIGAQTGHPPVVECPDCAGTTLILAACRCILGGNHLLVESSTRTTGEAYADCRLCHGVGTVVEPCHDCRQLGVRRAQLVLTVANLDTGAVASTSVIPGTVEPVFDQDGHPVLDLTPLVRELAGQVGATAVSDVATPGQPFEELTILLPAQWRLPELPAEERYALVAAALARRSWDPWLVHVGRNIPPPAPPTPAQRLARLVTLAGQLCLDLVVEARNQPYGELTWTVRYDVPAAPVPADQRGRFEDLAAALAARTVADALSGLHERGLNAPAYLVIPNGPPSPPGPTDLDIGRLDRRIRAGCTDSSTGEPTSGAQAIWRDGRWWHTSLRPAGTHETYTESDTGQIIRRRHTLLRRGWEPPDPTWQGPAIPYVDCPDCPNSPDTGTGPRPLRPPCRTCRDSRRLLLGAVITLTDLDAQVTHLNWPADRERPLPTPLVALQPSGAPVVQLPDHYRLARWASILGVCPEHLAELDGAASISPDSRDGTVTLHDPDHDPLTQHLTTLSAGRPGARLLVHTTAPDAPPLAELIRLAHGLRLALAVTAEFHQHHTGDPLRVNTETWQIDLLRPDLANSSYAPQRPHHSSLATAIAHCYAYLELSLTATVPTDPRQPIPIPRFSPPLPRPQPADDPTETIRRLGRQHPGQPVTVLLTPTGCRIHRPGDAVTTN
jgi:hypothetical protein